MKREIRNFLAATGLALLVLSLVAVICHGRYLCIETVFQTAASCAVIHLGLGLLKAFESKYFLIEISLEICFTLGVLILSGIFFGWYTSIPLWVLIFIGLVVYGIGNGVGIYKLQSDIHTINEQLRINKEAGREL